MDAHRRGEHHGPSDQRPGTPWKRRLVGWRVGLPDKHLDETVSYYPLVCAGGGSTPDANYCGDGSLNGLDVKGKIVLCDRGNNIGWIDKGAEVKRAGGFGMILANEFSHGYSTLADLHVLPA
jgi:hypothetical protein